ncbi:hypothetical protein MMC22_001474 [Lobaria immixta]|nr:hypothetical protein [Lobaria immixta]
MGRPKKANKRKERSTTSTGQTGSPPQVPLPPQASQKTSQHHNQDPDSEVPSMRPHRDVSMNDEDFASFSMQDWEANPSLTADTFNLILDSSSLPSDSSSPPSYTTSNHFHSQRPGMISNSAPAILAPSESLPQQQHHAQRLGSIRELFEDRFTSPGQLTSPTATHINHMRTNSIKSTDGNHSTDHYRALSKLLFDLRFEHGQEWSLQDSEASRRAGVFGCVSSLCDIVQSVFTFRDELNLTPWLENEESNVTYMLTFTAISVVLDIYQSLARTYTQCAGKETSNSKRLDHVVQLTIMDFHLSRLQQVFRRLDTMESSRAPLTGSDNKSARIQELRELLKAFIEKLKAETV